MLSMFYLWFQESFLRPRTIKSMAIDQCFQAKMCFTTTISFKFMLFIQTVHLPGYFFITVMLAARNQQKLRNGS